MEDNKELQELYCYFLKKLARSVNIDIANNGIDALTQSMARAYDLILMDVQMPKLNGIEAVKQLRERNYTGRILCVTARATPQHHQEYISLGFDDVFLKPINWKVLLPKIREMVR